MKHSSSLAIWLSLGAVFLGLMTTFISLLLASQRKKAANNLTPPGPARPEPEGERPN